MIYLNDGFGGFSVAQEIKGSTHTDTTAVTDVNNDGILGYHIRRFCPKFCDCLSSVIYLGDGTGHFSNARSFGIPTGTSSIAVNDVNNDGSLDTIATNFSQPSTIYLNDGAGNFTATRSFDVSNTVAIALGDLSGDGTIDIVAGVSISSTVYLNDTGNFSISHLLGDTRTDQQCCSRFK